MNQNPVKKSGWRLYLLFAALLIMAGCGPDPFYIRVVTIEDVPETGTVGTPLALTGTIRPAFASNKDIIWIVKNAGTTGASISGNILNAEAVGKVTITAVIIDGKAEGLAYTQDFYINIVYGDIGGGDTGGGDTGGDIGGGETGDGDIPVTGVTLDRSALHLVLGSDAKLTETVVPVNASNKNVIWKSSDNNVAAVTNGDVTAVSLGTATITVTTADGGFTATCEVTVLSAEARIALTGVEYATLTAALNAADYGSLGAPTEIVILSDITANSGYTIPDGKNIKLTVEYGQDRAITAATGDFCLFTVNTGSSLTLGPTTGGGKLTLSGGNEAAETNRRGVNVTGTLILNGGVTITGFKNSDPNTSTGNGSGVYVGSSGTFTMNGGEISGNTGLTRGGGVYNYGNFTMDGGEISSNTSSYNGGGVYVGTSGIFTMNSGEISGNKATNSGGGVSVNTSGTFTMKGGTIKNNSVNNGSSSGWGGGVNVSSNGNFTMDGGEISGNTSSYIGGGVCVQSSGTFTMNGGTIIGNTATSNSGGGVYSFGTFTMNGGEIKSNNANYGGGVGVSGTFNMNNGTISGNTASNYGGGVIVTTGNNTDGVTSYYGTFTMSGGTIYGTNETNTNLRNKATNSGASVYVNSNSAITAKYGGTYGTNTINTTNNTLPPVPAVLNSVTANGSATQSTTQLTLTFDKAISGLTAANITLSGVSGVTKGTQLPGSNPYNLTISGFTADGTLSVAVANSDYVISGSPKTVNIFYYSAVTGVTLNKTNTTLIVGGATETLTATVAPPNATNNAVTWTSSNTAVATVNNGVVTAVAAGTANITVTTADGNKTATCAVTVKTTVNQGFVFVINPDESPTVETNTGIIISRSGNNGPTEITLKVSSGYSNIAWYYNDIKLGTAESLILNSSDSRYNMIGLKFVRVEAWKNGVPYSVNIEFEVKP